MTTLGVTGATGFLSSTILTRILDRAFLPASQIIATCRDPTSPKVQTLASRGITIRQADFAKPDTLPTAFKGIDTLLIISPNVLGEDGGLTKAAIDAAKTVGVRKVYYTSHTGAKHKSAFSPAAQHYAVEQYLEASGLGFTSLRNGFYMSSLSFLIGDPIKVGSITVPTDGKVSWTDRVDLAHAIAAIVTGAYDINGARYIDLVNTQKWDMEDVARILSQVTGKEISRKVIDDETYVKNALAAGTPEMFAKWVPDTMGCTASGDFGKTDGVVEEIMGRECKNLDEYLQETYGKAA